jgi:hypothetical protein
MKYYTYQDPDGTHTFSTSQIFDQYWPYWYSKMVKKYGPDSPLVNWESCLDDWITVHWAYEERPTEK